MNPRCALNCYTAKHFSAKGDAITAKEAATLRHVLGQTATHWLCRDHLRATIAASHAPFIRTVIAANGGPFITLRDFLMASSRCRND